MVLLMRCMKSTTQRSSGGFLITEATGISQHGLGWFKAPGKFVLLYVLGAKSDRHFI